MIKKSWLTLFVFFLVACHSTPQFSPSPSIELVLHPSATTARFASPTPAEVVMTSTPQPTKDPNFFRDDFDGALDPLQIGLVAGQTLGKALPATFEYFAGRSLP